MANDIVGKVLTISDLAKIPSRVAFLDKDEVAACRATMRLGDPIEFLPVAVEEIYIPENTAGKMAIAKFSRRVYKIALYGVVPSGEKITVILDNIKPYFEVRVPDGADAREFLRTVRTAVDHEPFKNCETNLVEGLGIKQYEDRAQFVQLHFISLSERKKALKYFDEKGNETAHDEATCYYRVVMREMAVSMTSWCTLSNYRAVEEHALTNTKWTVSVPYMNVKQYAGDILENARLCNDLTVDVGMDLETYDSVVVNDVPRPGSRTAEMFKMSLVFTHIDAETLPKNCDPACADYTWPMPRGHLVHYDITTAATAPMPNRVVVHCRDMQEMLLAMAAIWSRMKPDYVNTFNGDNYDWHWIAEKARQYKMLDLLESSMSLQKLDVYRQQEFDEKRRKFVHPRTAFEASDSYNRTAGAPAYSAYRHWYKYQFKISADLQNFPGAYLNYPGYINIDLMPQLRAACQNPDKYSLNFFLDKFKIGSKVDMDYQVMFRMYRDNKKILERLRSATPPLRDMSLESLRECAQRVGCAAELEQSMREMQLVGEYCIVDSLRCHDLMVATCYIRDKRELGNISFTPMNDCVYRANGMKIRNLYIGRSSQRNIHISNKSVKCPEIGKFPGALVFPPTKGVAVAKPMPREMRRADHIERYKKWVEMPEPAYLETLAAVAQYGIWRDAYPDEVYKALPRHVRDWIDADHHYPIAGLDFSSLYPSLIMTYNLSPEMMVHTVDRAAELATAGKQIHSIRFPFNGRTVKGWSVRHTFTSGRREDEEAAEFGIVPSLLLDLFTKRKKIKQQMKQVEHELENMTVAGGSAMDSERYNALSFRFNYLKTKQNVVKVFMNSVYGELGNALSPIRVLALAGGVTSAGQANLMLAAGVVERLGCRRYYGDTDSVYISMPKREFLDLDRQYYGSDTASKRDYYRDVVTRSFELIVPINKTVNDELERNNGTKFLSMAFEEFLYGTAFFSKKKYCGIAHLSVYNPNPDKIFVRGLEYVKKTTSPMLTDLSLEILWRVFDPDNLLTLVEIVMEKIRDIYTNKNVDFEKFIKTACYRPTKKNPCVQAFVKRMQAIGMAPVALDRFQYVVVRKYPYKYDTRGRKTVLGVGDRMEYADRARQMNWDIDLDYYMSKNVCGQLARFVSYDEKFHVTPKNDTAEAYDEAEKKTINMANKYILNSYKTWSSKCISKGPALRNLYKKVNTVFKMEFDNVVHITPALLSFDVARDVRDGDDNDYNIYNSLVQKIEHQALTESKRDADQLLAKLTITKIEDWVEKRNTYKLLKQERDVKIATRSERVLARLKTKINRLKLLLEKRDTILELGIQTLSPIVGVNAESFMSLEPILERIRDLDSNIIRSQIAQGIKKIITIEDFQLINDIDELCIELLSLYKLRITTTVMHDELCMYVRYKLGDSTMVYNDREDVCEWIANNLL